MRQRHDHHRGPQGHGRQRARRGEVAIAVMKLLDERPMHGYELITALEERSGGRWRPSPGAIYPALSRLERHGVVSAEDDGDKRLYRLTDKGRAHAEAMRVKGVEDPWERSSGPHGELRRAVSELAGPTRQIMRFGTPEQQAAALATLQQATATLYRLLADGATGVSPDEHGPDPVEEQAGD